MHQGSAPSTTASSALYYFLQIHKLCLRSLKISKGCKWYFNTKIRCEILTQFSFKMCFTNKLNIYHKVIGQHTPLHNVKDRLHYQFAQNVPQLTYLIMLFSICSQASGILSPMYFSFSVTSNRWSFRSEMPSWV